MPCNHCNSTKEPDKNGVCPDCGEVVSQSYSAQQSKAQPEVNEKEQYPVLHWRCTWLILLFHLINAVLLAVALYWIVKGVYYYDTLDTFQNEQLNNWKDKIWMIAMAIPAAYFFLGFLSFLCKWFIKRYELRPKEIRLIKGFFNLSTNSTLLETLRGITFRQNWLQRILGTGKITIYSDDVTAPVLHINDIGRVRKQFDELVRYLDYALDCSNVKVEKDTKIDVSTQVWRYSWRDLIDEIFWGILISAAFVSLWRFTPWEDNTIRAIITLCVPVIYWACGLIWTSFKGVFFTLFTNAFGILMTAVCITLAFPLENNALRLLLLTSVPVVYWCWLMWTVIDKIFFTRYTLNIATLIRESGVLNKNIDVYVLCHIRDCEMSQNLWQRIIGNIGNITLHLEWKGKETESTEKDDSSSKSGKKTIKKEKTKKEVLHGLKDHTKVFETFKERWLRERHRRQA